MAEELQVDKCAHPACNCTPMEGSDFCSAYCEKTDARELICHCGHTGCGEDRP